LLFTVPQTDTVRLNRFLIQVVLAIYRQFLVIKQTDQLINILREMSTTERRSSITIRLSETPDSPLSSKVALFNQTAQSHRESQLTNPFSDAQATRGMARLQISKEEYGKPKAGSLTEYRGKKANIQVYQEMLELCQVIDVDGQPVSKKNPDMKMIYFGELFNIYTHINDKLVGLLLRARKHEFIQFEGECLFQRRDDHVPVYLTKPITQIRDILVGKQTEIRRSLSPNPQPTNMLP
uniref:Uncharacterized protein n=2 Tax=Anopheles atroparvus TaxID=41427 RepID=A0A182IQA8_ANOAO